MHEIIRQNISYRLLFIIFCLLPQPLLRPYGDIALARNRVAKSPCSEVNAAGFITFTFIANCTMPLLPNSVCENVCIVVL